MVPTTKPELFSIIFRSRDLSIAVIPVMITNGTINPIASIPKSADVDKSSGKRVADPAETRNSGALSRRNEIIIGEVSKRR